MNTTFIHLSGKPDQSHHRLISMMDTLLAKMDAETKKKKLQEEHNLPMTIKLEKEMNDMCNLSSGIREESRMEGKLEGRVETTIEFIKNIMFKRQSSAEEAMELLGIDKAEYPPLPGDAAKLIQHHLPTQSRSRKSAAFCFVQNILQTFIFHF